MTLDPHKAILASIRRRVKEHPRSSRELLAAVGKNRNYLSQLEREGIGLRISFVVDLAHELGLDPAELIGSALDYEMPREHYLRQIETPSSGKGWEVRRLEATLQKLVSEAPEEFEPDRRPVFPEETPNDEEVRSLLKSFFGLAEAKRGRALRSTQKYRSVLFALALIERLDLLRDDEPKLAGRLARNVAIELAPRLRGTWRERLGVFCLAAGVFGTAKRIEGRLGVTARVLNRVLSETQRCGLRDVEAALLRRAATLLKYFGQPRRGQRLVEEAGAIYRRLGFDQLRLMAAVDIGLLLRASSDFEDAVEELANVVTKLPTTTSYQQRFRISSFQCLAFCAQQIGDLTAARSWLNEALSGVRDASWQLEAKISWQLGRLALQEGDTATAKVNLSASAESLSAKGDVLALPVCLDLASCLLARKERSALVGLAHRVVGLFQLYEDNPVGQSIVATFYRQATAGALNEQEIGRLVDRTRRACAPRGARRVV